ncbi:hypothetical protein [Hyphomicrobium sp. CS1BSMeth3]|uniref:hypothetical protein n=1 Tax=Hyphomicrobium sp. CS1BSMeth3 TaxID=1892844 RepID=UPI0009300265|nr:hypothetical protein [Hyphomicrobium sp. CS1BSMeth3]
MSTVTAIESLISSGEPVTMDAIGGRAVIEVEQDELLRSPHLDVLVGWAASASASEQIFADDLVIKGFEHARYATTFRTASEALIASETLRHRVGSRLVKALEARAAARSNNRCGLIAAYALETWLRLALGGVVTRHRLLSVLIEIGPNENGLFVEHATKIVGVAFHAWREHDLLEVLERLRRNAVASGEATFEYGYALLSVALEGDDQRALMDGLESARTLFAEAALIDADRSEARVYAAVINIAQRFARGAPATDLQFAVDALVVAASDRAFLLSADRLPDWLAPRWDRDVQWFRLLDAIPRLAAELDRPSWLHACEVLDRLLQVYDADRTIAGGAGFGLLLKPRLEASFIRNKGLLAHLEDRLRDPKFIGEYRDVASALRERIFSMAAEPSTPGKPKEGAYIQELRGALNDIGAPEEFTDRVMEAARGKIHAEDRIANPAVQRIYADVRSKLAVSFYYSEQVKVMFDLLVLQVILFCIDRQDAASKELGSRGAYLFAEHPVEADLQKDLREFLVGNITTGGVQTEVEGIAKGRADIYVGHGGWRFLIELKKHEGVVSPDVAKSYLGQAASYQGTNVKLGLLGVLELVDRTGPPPSIESCIWYDSLVPEGDTTARHLVVFKVPGRMRRPSELSR